MGRYAAIALVLFSAACVKDEMSDTPKMVGMPNPASAYCVEQGGKLEIRRESAGEVGYCHLPDGRVIEEWTLFRAKAPRGK